ncbi:phosphoglycerate mutase (2,3-diphosphoglycerate-independent) [Candidatus Woesebacteria bacterium RIFCSPLOWO2_01_FULL_39_21]|uniref:2,3-bisphosphoglycerate-independent phosphoglycerate mutase n=1 Tax=Candidatus Woesebacteria bacterium RIFCSPLOWO2_01_FULL_39_21 TaxID=1802519 RepID=A0A1F8BGE5_9BACT|nr:MAG: phosphoglycerate mutase (2,3-diphosphoglycerate-independent) [Candidatus Woesebacteria bacterium RIFCSPHIGHO2_01_FULL_39_23]OGM63146.1 MAG: phosphoglycerate mutase (2,3-diphosphoglycerate-independent) [Candidatus Woesebacteria bacterium RIFCSPLOWO2_01_FULL_39_21]
MENNQVIMVVLDGWGIAPPGPGNAISQAQPPNFTRFWASFPHTQLLASGESVGLPKGEDGNTETGHLNLGAGRIIYQNLQRINMSIADGSFFENKVLKDAFVHAKNNGSNVHMMGLVGAGGVHSNIEHLFALLRFAKNENFMKVYLHLFTDGRDSAPTSARTYISQVHEVIKRENVGIIASIMGRYWAMDRDLRWDRTAKAYFALTKGAGSKVSTPEEAIESSYNQGKTDEFIEPSLIVDSLGNPLATIKSNDSIIFFNFRVDRPRQLSRAFVLKDFEKQTAAMEFDPYRIKYEKSHLVTTDTTRPTFERGAPLSNLYFVTMTEYEKILVENGAKVAYAPELINMPLGRIISENNLKQLRAAESEKERFVTYYFNGLQGDFAKQENLIVPSPKVPTYDLKPEMSAHELTKEIIERLKNNGYSFALVNFANADMVGHTGNIGAAVTACKVIDDCIGGLANFILAYGGYLILTADHGNVEEMINLETGAIDTEHSTFPVPFVVISKEFLNKPFTLEVGILADVSPTILSLLGITPPIEMTGRNLLGKISETAKKKHFF